MEREGQLYNASCSSLIKELEMEFTSKQFEHQTISSKKKKKKKKFQKGEEKYPLWNGKNRMLIRKE